MYHHVSVSESRDLTIGTSRLEEQFKWLRDNNFKSWHFSELEELRQLPPGNNVMITFDDAYVSFRELALPLLQKYQLKATLFVPLAFLGGTDEWYSGQNPIMTSSELNTLDPSLVELGHHSFFHKKFHQMSSEEIKEDINKCREVIAKQNLNVSPALAYPYGKYPREKPAKEQFITLLKEEGFKFGLRIGNRLNAFPFKNSFEIQRLDIKGEYGLSKFKRKIKFGKVF
ncbi:MAG: polysaccharide deacetylase family protein [Bacteroidia bacterium]|nr:polysaccharide deacetylase family protein [Bacteroidia bacterium]NNF30179.1 polysaccharide deacetylase family protein [Flavobacteriaceae bacterium]NNK54430.1 polysaccharide deacetylase family protein [Flavobacteriaceae bacterium]NNM08181.1 polysaccharide deacetylase family protein [Flavobacteriaceae bacterium]